MNKSRSETEWDVKVDSEGFKVIIPWTLEQLQKLSCGHTPTTNEDDVLAQLKQITDTWDLADWS